MTFEAEERPFGKRDRLARMLRVVAVLRGHPEGIRPAEIARRTGVATRTVYRDLRALETEVGVAVWSEDGLWGVVGEEFLPALKLTLDEAMAVVLSATPTSTTRSSPRHSRSSRKCCRGRSRNTSSGPSTSSPSIRATRRSANTSIA